MRGRVVEERLGIVPGQAIDVLRAVGQHTRARRAGELRIVAVIGAFEGEQAPALRMLARDARREGDDLGTVLRHHAPGHGRKTRDQALDHIHQRRREQARRIRASALLGNRGLDLRVQIAEQIRSVRAQPVDVATSVHVDHLAPRASATKPGSTPRPAMSALRV